jgi:predicted amidophosphoribosyltransferase
VGLSALERRNNVEGAFWANLKVFSNKSVLLMDEVATTGSTLDSASQALYEAGVINVYAVTVTSALAHHGLNVI